jgi:hypothetical protein
MGVSGADALGHPVINLMFFIPIRYLKGFFLEENVMIILECLVE